MVTLDGNQPLLAQLKNMLKMMRSGYTYTRTRNTISRLSSTLRPSSRPKRRLQSACAHHSIASRAKLAANAGTPLSASTRASALSGMASKEITSKVTANANAASTNASMRVTSRPRSGLFFAMAPPSCRHGSYNRGMTFHASALTGDKPEQYAQLLDQARALMHGERDLVANAANLSALLWHALP